jgi:hypothetical protein
MFNILHAQVAHEREYGLSVTGNCEFAAEGLPQQFDDVPSFVNRNPGVDRERQARGTPTGKQQRSSHKADALRGMEVSRIRNARAVPTVLTEPAVAADRFLPLLTIAPERSGSTPLVTGTSAQESAAVHHDAHDRQ